MLQPFRYSDAPKCVCFGSVLDFDLSNPYIPFPSYHQDPIQFLRGDSQKVRGSNHWEGSWGLDCLEVMHDLGSWAWRPGGYL